MRGMYLFGCVFLDVIVILPFLPVFNFSYFRTLYGFQYFGNLNLYLPYAIILTGFLEIVAIYYEGHFWIKFFGEDATERRYAIKSH
ncbi:MAG TPA: hypothetical protein VKU79_02480 [Thermoplasmataceae archaeon]|nr:hypothetical protein [Thermoplasmataceae archaeon]